MTWALVYATSAARTIKRLDPAVRRRLLAALERLREDPERGKPLLLTLKGLRSLRTATTGSCIASSNPASRSWSWPSAIGATCTRGCGSCWTPALSRR